MEPLPEPTKAPPARPAPGDTTVRARKPTDHSHH